jgi:polysaccharide biosynthesis protein PslH
VSRRAVVVLRTPPLPAVSGGRKRALRLLEAMERAGAEPYLVVLESTDEARAACRRRGWPVEVVPRPPLRLRARSAQYVRMEPAPPHPTLVGRLRELARASVWIQLEEVDFAQLAPRLDGTRVVVSLYNVDSAVERRLARRRAPAQAATTLFRAARLAVAEFRAVRAADALICVSEEDRAILARRSGRRPIVVPNGVDDDLFGLPINGGEAGRVLFFGAHWWAPNRDGLIRFLRESWPTVVAARPHARLRVVGPGRLDAVARACEGVPGVELVGLVDDLPAELRSARLAVVPVWVGGGTRIKVLEAMGAGRPVVGTAVAVERLGFRDGQHGFVRDTPSGLADGCVALLDDEARARRLGESAREHVRPMRWTQVTAPAEAHYRAWCGDGPPISART